MRTFEVSQSWLVRFVKHRIGDPRIILIQKWLRVDILDDGIVTVSGKGTGQGSVISPLLANVYLHYVFDLCKPTPRPSITHKFLNRLRLRRHKNLESDESLVIPY
jgi:retron-type reverse transcriptase